MLIEDVDQSVLPTTIKDVAAITFNDGAESDKHRRTFLNQASGRGDMKAVKEQLFANPKSTDVPDDLGDLALHHAAINGHTEVARLLLEAGCNVNCQNYQGMRPLHDAAAKGHTKLVRLLLNVSKCDIDCLNGDKETPLHQAVKYGRAGVVQQLVSAGAHVDCQNRKGSTPLHLAAKAGHVGIARSLIEAKADANLRDNNGDSPLHLTYQRVNSELRSLLVSATTDPTIIDKTSLITESIRNTPFRFAPALQRMLKSSETLEEAYHATLMAISRHENGPYDVNGAMKAIQVVIEESHVAWTEIYDWARNNAFVREPEENEIFRCSRRCLESKILTMFALTKLLIILQLQRPSQASLLHSSGLHATTTFLALDELIIGLDRSMNDEWLLVTCRTYLLLVGILQRKRTNDGESQPHRLELSPSHRAQFELENKGSVSFSRALFKLEKENSVIKTLSGTYEVTWELEKVLANRQFSYTIKSHQGKLKAADVHDDSDEEAGEFPSDEADMMVEQGDESHPFPEGFASRLQTYRERIVYETVTVGWLGRAASLEPSQALDEHLAKIKSMLQRLEEEAASLNSSNEFYDP